MFQHFLSVATVLVWNSLDTFYTERNSRTKIVTNTTVLNLPFNSKPVIFYKWTTTKDGQVLQYSFNCQKLLDHSQREIILNYKIPLNMSKSSWLIFLQAGLFYCCLILHMFSKIFRSMIIYELRAGLSFNFWETSSAMSIQIALFWISFMKVNFTLFSLCSPFSMLSIYNIFSTFGSFNKIAM